jgi:hypothetical protein
MPNPLLSVAIPLRSAAPFTGEALASIYGQSHAGLDACANSVVALKRGLDRRRQRT